MNLFEQLPEEEIERLHHYIINYGGGSCDSYVGELPYNRMEYFLRYWNTAKAPFYKAFGNQFIIKQPVCFEKDYTEMEDEVNSLIYYSDTVIQKFINTFCERINNLPLGARECQNLKRLVRDHDYLISNIYDGEPITIPASETIDGHPLQINSGCKTVKMVGKIAKALGIKITMYKCSACGKYHSTNPINCHWCASSEFEETDGYEAFRKAHSLILNQKMIRGNLCLSIHPLDYLTMSDNESGWTSCMSWMEEAGDYRMGTIEMMNSPTVIIAYVEAKNDMSLGNNYYWNNKRWRQLIVVTPELILGNKQYPYNNDVLQGTALKWVRQLVENSGLYGPYNPEAVQIRNQRQNTIGTRSIYINLYFNYMYNDIYDSRLAFISSNWNGIDLRVCLSGPAVCTSCGEEIPPKGHPGESEPHWTTCHECNGMWKCAHCGEWCYGEPHYSEADDAEYCDWCWSHNLDICEVCGERTDDARRVYIQLAPNLDEELECFNWTYLIDVCHNCYNNSSEFEDLFGKMYSQVDMWGRTRSVVSVTAITDEGFRCGALESSTVDILKRIRDAKSDEERVNLIREILC